MDGHVCIPCCTQITSAIFALVPLCTPLFPVHADATAATLLTLVLLSRVWADTAAATLFALVLLPPMHANAPATTLFALVFLPSVRANLSASTLLARTLLPSVRADPAASALLPLALYDSTAATFFALALQSRVRADATAATVLTRALDPLLHIDRTSSAFFARALLPPVHALLPPMVTLPSLLTRLVRGRLTALPRHRSPLHERHNRVHQADIIHLSHQGDESRKRLLQGACIYIYMIIDICTSISYLDGSMPNRSNAGFGGFRPSELPSPRFFSESRV
jgi:hypothetical protein